ncbi:MAG: hypothetical protein V4594_17730 [Bacteroidota bacterium]
MKKGTIVFLILLGSFCAIGQGTEKFDISLKRMHLKFQKPADLNISSYVGRSYMAHSSNPMGLSFDQILNTDNDDLQVGFIFFDNDTTNLLGTPKYITPEDNYIVEINSQIDTSSNYVEVDGQLELKSRRNIMDTTKVHLLKGDSLKNTGAEVAGFFEVPIEFPYRKKYKLCSAYFMNKKERGVVYMYYFYNEGFPIKKYLKNAVHLLTFKD